MVGTPVRNATNEETGRAGHTSAAHHEQVGADGVGQADQSVSRLAQHEMAFGGRARCLSDVGSLGNGSVGLGLGLITPTRRYDESDPGRDLTVARGLDN